MTMRTCPTKSQRSKVRQTTTSEFLPVASLVDGITFFCVMMEENNVMTTMIPDDPRLTSSLRGDARKSMAEKWANRRRLQEASRKANGRQDCKSSGRDDSLIQKANNTICQVPLCVALRRTWNETIRKLQLPPPRKQQPQRPSHLSSKRESFPSVLSILHAKALKDQVESFHQYNNNTNNDDTTDTVIKDIFLPDNYDFHHAIGNMSQSRSRVFLLLDLAAIVKSFVTWKKRLKSASCTKIQMVYATKHNANPKLLQVLHRLGVAFQVSTTYDLEQVLHVVATTANQEQNNNDTTTSTRIYDDTERLAKPNSFYRSLILDHPDATPTPMVVDGPVEVTRLIDALERIAKRRRQQMPCLKFLLKLQATDSLQEWKTVLEQTIQATCSTQHRHELIGIALQLPDNNIGKNDKNNNNNNNPTPHLLESLDELILETPRGNNKTPTKWQLHLTTTTTTSGEAIRLDPQLQSWLTRSNQPWTEIMLDISHLLVSNAGALCTRIIGVKQNSPGKIHYYIDDGCYGSLSHMSGNDKNNNTPLAVPMPLLDNKNNKTQHAATSTVTGDNDDKTTKNNQHKDEQPQEQLLATVWGPTCDGLDKVCSDLPLPKLSRDDWLVFGNLGFCHVGTNFNGFAPPDVAYCVLGGGYYLYPQQQQQSAANTKE